MSCYAKRMKEQEKIFIYELSRENELLFLPSYLVCAIHDSMLTNNDLYCRTHCALLADIALVGIKNIKKEKNCSEKVKIEKLCSINK